EIAARVLFSANFASCSETFGAAMDVLNESMGHIAKNSFRDQDKFGAALGVIRRTVRLAILARRFCDTGEDDLLALLLRSQREHNDPEQHLIDQAVTILLAGHETTAKGLSWTIALLCQHPQVRDRLLAELRDNLGDRLPGAGDVPNLTYTRAVL